MELFGISIITHDVPRAVAFYAALLDTTWEGDETHAFVHTRGVSLTVYNADAARADMGLPVAVQGSGVIISFRVEDVDAHYARALALSPHIINPPTDWPWGARSMQFLDPDGNIVTFVQPPR